MKTLEQVLENVTAGGQWKADGSVLRAGHQNRDRVADFMNGLMANDHQVNAAYAALAASLFPALVRALENISEAWSKSKTVDWEIMAPAVANARAVLAEALKD